MSSAKSCVVQGITVYQADYNMVGFTVRANDCPLQPVGNQPFNVPMASLKGQDGENVWYSCCIGSGVYMIMSSCSVLVACASPAHAIRCAWPHVSYLDDNTKRLLT